MASSMSEKIKAILGFGADSSQGQTDSGDGQPLTVEASNVSADFQKVFGVGSLGTIYTGNFRGKKCAVKVFNRGVIQRDVVQNYDIASIIQHHPNVVLVHGLWYGNPANRLPNNDPALVMELCTMSLDAFIKERVDKGEVAVFRVEKRLEILNGVTSGMIYLHSKRIIHGHLSAKKVFLSFSGPSIDKTILAKVAGVCQMKLCTQDTVLRHQTSVQRSGIMPPEVKDGGEDVELTEAVDVFSFGCLIAHVATCIYPVPNAEAGLNEFQKRAHFITGNSHAHIYGPLMKRCLDEHPVARGTFEDAKKDLSVHQSKYGGKQAQKLEDQIREMENRKGEMLALEREVDQLKREMENRKGEMLALEREAYQLKKQVESLQKANNELQKELEDTAKHSKTCESERDHLREEKKVWEKREADLKDSVKKLKETCTEMAQCRMELYAQLKELKVENEAVRTQQMEDSKKMSSLQVALQTEKDKLCNAEKAMCQKEKEIKKCKADLQAEKDKVHTMEKAALQKDRDLDQCRTELKFLKAKKKHQENAVMTELQEKLHRAEDVRVKLLGEKEDQKKREAALHDTVKELEQQHSNLVRQLSEREDQRDSLQREKADLLHRNHQLAVDKENVLKEKEEHLKQYKDVERKLHRLSGNHAKKMAESEKEIQRLKKELEETVKTFETTVGALQKELEDTMEHSKTCESERDHLRDEKRVWVKREADLEDSVKKLKETCTDMEQSRMELHAQLKELKAENGAAKTQQKADSKKTSNLQVALQAEKDKSCNTEETMRQKEKEVKKYKADLQAEKDKVHIMEVAALQKDRDLDQCKASLKTSKEHTASVEEQLDHFQKKLREKESANTKLLQSLKDKEGEMKEVKQQKAKLENSTKRQDDRMTQLKTKADEMDVQLKKERQEWALERNALQQENAELKKNISEMDEQLKRESSEWQSEITALKLEVATGKEHAKAQKKKHQPKQTSLPPTAPAKGSDVVSPSPPTPAPASNVPPNVAGHNIGSENSSMFDVQNESFPSVSMGSMSGSNSTTNLMKTYMQQFEFQGMYICREWKWWLIPILLCLCVFLLRLFGYL